MYILRFLKELELLHNENCPNKPNYPKDKCYYYGHIKASEVKKEFDLDGFEEKEGDYLIFAPASEPFNLNYLNVTDTINYLNKLKINVDTKGIGEKELTASLYEALWLFDLLMCSNHNH